MPSGRGARTHDRDGLRVAQLRDEEHLGIVALGQAREHVHGLGGSGRFVEQRCSRDLQPAQIYDHGLEIEQGLQSALRDLGLVGRVGGIPAGIFQDVALDDRRQDGLRVAHADVGADAAVAATQPAQLPRTHARSAAGPAPAAGWHGSPAGRVCSISSSSEDARTTRNMSARSAGRGPMWRRRNSSCVVAAMVRLLVLVLFQKRLVGGGDP